MSRTTDQIAEQSQLPLFNVREQQLYSELFSNTLPPNSGCLAFGELLLCVIIFFHFEFMAIQSSVITVWELCRLNPHANLILSLTCEDNLKICLLLHSVSQERLRNVPDLNAKGHVMTAGLLSYLIDLNQRDWQGFPWLFQLWQRPLQDSTLRYYSG